mmetsp:Transcript_26430/g.44973  ORF Transcript_26430/g.44973 Transcript_26430/m.44973 type:complete len:940 (-) Transcript_26430:290-3109(-)
MVYGSAGGNSSLEGRSKLSSAVAQASARMNNKNKASIFRRSGEQASSLNNMVNENAANHEGVAKPSPQDAPTSEKRRGVHKSKATQKSVSGSQSSRLPKMQQQQEQEAATPLPTQPQRHFADMLLRRKDQKPRAAPSISEPPMTYDPPPITHDQKPPYNTGIGSRNSSKRNNMVQRKSHQRLVLEQIAAKYFLNNNEKFSRYVGVSNDDNMSTDNLAADNVSSLGGGGGGSATTPLGLADNQDERRGNKEQEALAEFLDILRDDADTDAYHNNEDNEASIENDGSSAISSVGVESQSTRETEVIPAESSNGKTSTAQQMQDIEEETNIDSLLEIASYHLSLGKNELALQAYRRAMKRAFADVMLVKNQLGEIKRQQAELVLAEQERKNADLSDYVESSELATSRKQEAEFELSLLQVASRVADIHNNMGVVHELNRSYKQAQTSYRDALDVYYNTCKRFKDSDDPDVDRTMSNVKRMKKACASEEPRTALHGKATSIAKQTRSSDPVSRNKALTAAVITLQQALKWETESLGSTHPVAANTLIQMGKYYYEMRKYDEAVSVIRQAIRNLQNALGKNHPQVCKAILLLASIYERHGLNVSPEGVDKDEALLEIYVDALDPLKTSLGEVHPEVGLVYTKIGYLYGKKRDLGLSLLAYKAALKAYGEPTSTTLLGGMHPEVLSVWVRVTEHLHSMKNWGEVLVAGERALFFLRLAKKSLFREAELYTNHYSSVSSTSDTASVNSISIVKTSKKSPIQITSGTYYSALYTTLSSLAQAHITLKNYQLARDACQESLQLGWEIALSSQPDDKSKGSNHEPLDPALHQLIRSLKRLGKVILLQKHYNDALECFLPCLELLRSSKTTESTLDTASVLGSLGFLYLKLKKFNESSNFLRECLRLYRKNGVDANDRETNKIKAWLEMAESREEDFEEPPTFLEIPIVI